MNDDTFTVKIQGDSEGYVSFECPYCGSEFKLQADEFQNEEDPFDELFCPYCGLAKSISSFYTKEVIEQAEAVAYNHMVEELNRAFGKMARSLNQQRSLIKITYKPLKKVTTKELKGKDTTETEFECACCNRHIKALYCAGIAKIFCPYCGVDI